MQLAAELTAPRSIKHQIKHSNVVFIEKAKLTCVVLPDKTTKEYAYPPEMVIDGDMINRDDFCTSLSAWLGESGIKIAETLFIVESSIVFQASLTPDLRTKSIDMTNIDSFIDSIPFQRITTIRRPLKTGIVKIIATNKDLVGVVQHVFEKDGYECLGIFPDMGLVSEGEEVIQNENIVDRAKRHLVMYTMKDSLQYAFNLLSHQNKPLTQMSVSEAAQQPVQPWVAVAIVALLVVIAVGVGYGQYYTAKQNQINLARRRAELIAQQKGVVSQKITPGSIHVAARSGDVATASASPGSGKTTPPSTTKPQESSSSANQKMIKIQILYTTQTEKLFEKIRSSLPTALGYQVTGQIETREMTENRLFVPPQMDPESAGVIADAVRSAGISVTQRQASIEGFDAVIELGSYTPTAPTIPLTQVTP